MILGKKFIPGKRHGVKRVLILECDICQKIYNRSYIQGVKQFCSYECSGLARTVGGLYYKQPRYFSYVCAHCSKSFKIQSSPRVTKTGLVFCSIECTNLAKLKGEELCELSLENRDDTFSLDRRIETVKERHGVENVSQLDWVREKAKASFLLNNGVTSISQLPEARKKSILTNQKRYGVDYPLQSEEIQKKCRESCTKSLGVPFPFLSPTFVQNNMPKTHHFQQGFEEFRGRDVWYRSSYEQRYIRYLNVQSDVVDIEQNLVVNYSYDGKTKLYFVDFSVFYASGKRVLVETKPASKVLLPKNLAKFDATLSQLSVLGFDEFRVVTEVDLDTLERATYSP